MLRLEAAQWDPALRKPLCPPASECSLGVGRLCGPAQWVSWKGFPESILRSRAEQVGGLWETEASTRPSIFCPGLPPLPVSFRGVGRRCSASSPIVLPQRACDNLQNYKLLGQEGPSGPAEPREAEWINRGHPAHQEQTWQAHPDHPPGAHSRAATSFREFPLHPWMS